MFKKKCKKVKLAKIAVFGVETNVFYGRTFFLLN